MAGVTSEAGERDLQCVIVRGTLEQTSTYLLSMRKHHREGEWVVDELQATVVDSQHFSASAFVPTPVAPVWPDVLDLEAGLESTQILTPLETRTSNAACQWLQLRTAVVSREHTSHVAHVNAAPRASTVPPHEREGNNAALQTRPQLLRGRRPP